jgi:hypothetical protein
MRKLYLLVRMDMEPTWQQLCEWLLLRITAVIMNTLQTS